MSMRSAPANNETDALAEDLLAKFFRALGDPTRLRILERLSEGPKTVTDLVAALGVPQSRISNHLACLKSCRFVTSRSRARFVIYALADPQLTALVVLARRIVSKNAMYFALCATVGA